MCRCHWRTLSDVAREYGVPYTTLERWFYFYAPEQLVEEEAQHICVDEFAIRKGHSYATSVLNAETGRILAIASVLSKVTGNIKAVASDFAPAVANAIQSVFQEAVHVLDRFHLIQFFTEALRRRRRYLNEAKKHHKVRFIDRCLARRPRNLTEEERGFIVQCGVVSKIVKTLIAREKALLDTILSPLSNGIMEGTNNEIKLIKRRGFGYRNDSHFFLRLRLETGVDFVTPNFR